MSVFYVYLHLNDGRLTFVLFQCRSSYRDTLPTDMSNRRFMHQSHSTIDTTTKNMFAATRCHGRLPLIVHTYCHQIFPILHIGSYINTESRITANMMTSHLTINVDFCLLKHTIKLQEKTFIRCLFYLKMLTIPTISHIEILRQEIWDTKRMWQSYSLPFSVIIARHSSSYVITNLITPLPVHVFNRTLRQCYQRQQQSTTKKQ